MTVADDIVGGRIYGVVRCGLSEKAAPPTLAELVRQFGLGDDPASYKEIDETAARYLIHLVLHRDMAYNAEVMPLARAVELADQFLAQFGPDTRNFSNGSWHLPPVVRPDAVACGPSWNPVTTATFDTGVLAIGQARSGCLWIEDED